MLYLCATPIGNLGDLTPRVAEAFRDCDAVYCEDTRRTLQLLNHLGVKKPLVSCHQHNEQMRLAEIERQLVDGRTLVYASDAGMPGISDPGEKLVRLCVEKNLDFTVLPGASAVLTAAVMSGLPPMPFSFFGFLPRDSKPRADMLDQIAACRHLVILYESPQRVQKTLQALLERLGDCDAAVLRELTKKFEQVRRGKLTELIPLYDAPLKGECVIAVSVTERETSVAPDAADAMLADALSNGLRVRDAADLVAQTLNLPRREVYRRALELRGGGQKE